MTRVLRRTLTNEMAPAVSQRGQPTVAFGPEMPGWGSWDWVGADIAQELSKSFRTAMFHGSDVPESDVVVFVKHAPPVDLVRQVARRSAVIYCPVDCYGDAAEIDADAQMLRTCDRVVIHCERLRKYFQSYSLVEYVDHHIRFTAPVRERFQTEGYVLWVGVRTNLPPLIEWLNGHSLPCELRILTNLEDPSRPLSPGEIGIRSPAGVTIENWSAERQLERTAEARAAIDVKGTDFRSRHKPAAKGIDFIASGVPLAYDAHIN